MTCIVKKINLFYFCLYHIFIKMIRVPISLVFGSLYPSAGSKLWNKGVVWNLQLWEIIQTVLKTFFWHPAHTGCPSKTFPLFILLYTERGNNFLGHVVLVQLTIELDNCWHIWYTVDDPFHLNKTYWF